MGQYITRRRLLVECQVILPGVADGHPDERTARCPWDALPGEYRAAVPEDRHAAAGKDAGIICHVEQFWATVWARCGQFVRRTLSFSKCPWNHVGSLWYFIRQYNACRL